MFIKDLHSDFITKQNKSKTSACIKSHFKVFSKFNSTVNNMNNILTI
jgi:hypothetical protein